MVSRSEKPEAGPKRPRLSDSHKPADYCVIVMSAGWDSARLSGL